MLMGKDSFLIAKADKREAS